MAGPLAPWTKRAFELLADGQWRDREWVIRQISPLVPPGRAKRKNEWARTRQARKEGREVAPRLVQRSDDFQIASGQRYLAVQTLGNGGFETKREEGRTWIRIRQAVKEPSSE